MLNSMRRLCIILLTAIAVSGCVDGSDRAAHDGDAAIVEPRGEKDASSEVLATRSYSTAAAVDAPLVCQAGLDTWRWEIPRQDSSRVQAGHAVFVVDLGVDGTSGMKVQAFLDGEIHAESPVSDGSISWTLELDGPVEELDGHRWTFWTKWVLGPYEDSCSAGYQYGAFEVRVVAHPAP